MQWNFDQLTAERETAALVHKRLRASKASILDMGEFYLSLLNQGLWASQREISTSLDISLSQLSRMVTAARLPGALIILFRDRPLTFRNVDTLQTLTRQLGEAEIGRRAGCVTDECSVDETFSILTTGKEVAREGVKLRLVPGQKYLRVDAPDFDQIAPSIPELEAVLNAMLPTLKRKKVLAVCPG
jgi:hypothetical protein